MAAVAKWEEERTLAFQMLRKCVQKLDEGGRRESRGALEGSLGGLLGWRWRLNY